MNFKSRSIQNDALKQGKFFQNRLLFANLTITQQFSYWKTIYNEISCRTKVLKWIICWKLARKLFRIQNNAKFWKKLISASIWSIFIEIFQLIENFKPNSENYLSAKRLIDPRLKSLMRSKKLRELKYTRNAIKPKTEWQWKPVIVKWQRKYH